MDYDDFCDGLLLKDQDIASLRKRCNELQEDSIRAARELESKDAEIISLRQELAVETSRLDHILDGFDGDEDVNGACAVEFWNADAMDADEKTELRRAWRAAIDAARYENEALGPSHLTEADNNDDFRGFH